MRNFFKVLAALLIPVLLYGWGTHDVVVESVGVVLAVMLGCVWAVCEDQWEVEEFLSKEYDECMRHSMRRVSNGNENSNM